MHPKSKSIRIGYRSGKSANHHDRWGVRERGQTYVAGMRKAEKCARQSRSRWCGSRWWWCRCGRWCACPSCFVCGGVIIRDPRLPAHAPSRMAGEYWLKACPSLSRCACECSVQCFQPASHASMPAGSPRDNKPPPPPRRREAWGSEVQGGAEVEEGGGEGVCS